MNHLGKVLFEAYDVLSDLGAVTSHNQFSRKFLRKSARYMSWLVANDNQNDPSIQAALSLYITLDDLHDDYVARGDASAKKLDALTEHLWGEIRKAVLISTPNTRSKRASPVERDGQPALSL